MFIAILIIVYFYRYIVLIIIVTMYYMVVTVYYLICHIRCYDVDNEIIGFFIIGEVMLGVR